jgi:3-hydroxy-9,10-secoandrosta-1,3,5(10)-triene-9,17-dione monooxygenase reductase component
MITFDSKGFRRALGRYVTGVVVISARGSGGEPIGLTCNSFSSLSLDPPLIQWAIARSSRNHAPMCAAEHFAVHVLDANQQDLCRQFSLSDGNRFAGVEVETGLYDLPLLKNYHARFECAVYARHRAGDHTLIIGQVLRLEEQEGRPLVIYGGATCYLESPLLNSAS